MHQTTHKKTLIQHIVQIGKRWFVVATLIIVGSFGTLQAWQQSMTTDEGIHVASSYLALTRGEHRFDPEHPFLFKYLTALPILLLQPNLPPDDQKLWENAKPTFYDSWKESREWSDQWIYKSGNNAQLMLFLARIPGVIVLITLCWLVFFTTRHWFGNSVARWALFFTAVNPTLLAHAPLTNTDVPVALTCLFVVWRLWLYFEKQSWKNVIWIGAALGIALTTKYSALVMLPVAAIWLVYTAVQKHQKVVPTILHLGATLGIIWAIIWLVYFGSSPFYPDGNASQAVSTARILLERWGYDLTSLSQATQWILPTAYTKGMLLTIGASMFGRVVYFLGTTYPAGVWFYFPTLLILKSQLIIVLIALTGIGLFAKQIVKPWSWKPVSILLWLTAGVMLYIALTSKLNLGIRHISQLLPLFSIYLAITVVYLRKIIVRKGLVFAIVGASIFPLVSQASDLIGFKNTIVYPSELSYQYFNDSNLDWGQQSEKIAEVVLENSGSSRELYINYKWSPYALTYYGVTTKSFDPQNPPKDTLIAVTATQLSEPAFAMFQEIQPIARVADNTYFYRITSN